MTAATFEIRIFADGELVDTQTFSAKEVLIGRKRPADLVLVDAAISARHAVIHFTGRTCIIEDLSSRTGVFVGGKQVRSHLLQPTDEITIGRFGLLVVTSAAADQPARSDTAPRGLAPFDVDLASEPALPTAPIREAPRAASRAPAAPTRPVEELEDQPTRVAAPFRGASAAPPRSRSIFTDDHLRTGVGDPNEFAGDDATTTDMVARPPLQEPVPEPPPLLPSRDRTNTAPYREPQRPARTPVKASPPAAQSPAPSIEEAPPSIEEAPPSIEEEAPSPIPFAAPTREAAKPAAQRREPEPFAAAPAPSARPHDDDDDDDEPFEPRFSLLSELTQASRATGSQAVAQITVHRGEQIEEVRYLRAGDKLRLPGHKGIFCQYLKSGELQFGQGVSPHIDGVTDGSARLTLGQGQGKSAEIELGPRRVHVRFVPRVVIPPPPARSIVPSRGDLTAIGSSFGVHLLVFLVLAIMPRQEAEAVDLNEGRFAKVEMKDLELEKPPEPPKPEPPKPPEPPPEIDLAPIVKRPVTKPTPTQHASRAPKISPPGPPMPGPPKPSAAANKLLAALGTSLPSNAPSSSAVAATNLDAVASTGHSSGGFKVSGVIGKLPGDNLRLAASGSAIGRIDTKSAGELTKNGKVGRLEASAGGGQIRGIVNRAPERAVQVQGQLDRGEIQKVINAHLSEVQGCYERRLIHNPGLRGKITFEWVIQATGAVGTVRVKFSDLRDGEVSNCIQASMRSWRFPEPRGGVVSVIYPFNFAQIGG